MTDEKTFQRALLNVEMEDGKMEFDVLFTNIYYIAVMFMIPLNEMIISPIFHRCIPSITRYGKTTVGMILQFGRYITLITLIVVIHHDNYTNMLHTNISLCIFQESADIFNVTTSLDYKIYSIPEFISAISYTTKTVVRSKLLIHIVTMLKIRTLYLLK